MKWSDGTELTTEDMRFKYYDVLLYSEDPDIPMLKVAPGALINGGEVIKLDIIDDYTFRFSWKEPTTELGLNVYSGYYTYPLPAHFMKQYHPKYAEKKDKEPSEMITDMKNMDKISNPDFPSVMAYIADEVKIGEYMVMKRNPYYWKVDPAGQQLPYVDKWMYRYIKSEDVALLNCTAGEVDFEHGRISYKGGPILWQSQKSGNYSLVPAFKGNMFSAIWVQQAWIARALRGEIDEPNARKLAQLLKNQKFIEALVHAIDTEQLTRAYVGAEMVDFLGETFPQIPYLSKSRGVGMYTDHPEVKELWEWVTEWQRYDIDRANAMLDELGLKVGGDGFRQYPDGGRVELSIGIWDGNELFYELCSMQGESWERNLKIKTYVQLGNRASHLQTWLLNSEIPMLGSSDRVKDWVTNIPYPLSSLSDFHGGYPILNWLQSEGASGVEPYPEQKDVLLQIKDIAMEQKRSSDPQEKLELAIEATKLVVYNGTRGMIVLAAQKSSPWLLSNKVKNYCMGATMDQSEVHVETWYIEE